MLIKECIFWLSWHSKSMCRILPSVYDLLECLSYHGNQGTSRSGLVWDKRSTIDWPIDCKMWKLYLTLVSNWFSCQVEGLWLQNYNVMLNWLFKVFRGVLSSCLAGVTDYNVASFWLICWPWCTEESLYCHPYTCE